MYLFVFLPPQQFEILQEFEKVLFESHEILEPYSSLPEKNNSYTVHRYIPAKYVHWQ